MKRFGKRGPLPIQYSQGQKSEVVRLVKLWVLFLGIMHNRLGDGFMVWNTFILSGTEITCKSAAASPAESLSINIEHKKREERKDKAGP